MAYEAPNIPDLRLRIENDIKDSLGISGNLPANSFIRAYSYAAAGAFRLFYSFGGYILKQCNPATATGRFLGIWASIWGLSRRAASYAEATVSVTGVEGAVIPSGTSLSFEGKEYLSQDEATINLGVATIRIVANVAGEASSLKANDKLSFDSAPQGLDSLATVSADGLISGTEKDDDAALRQRLKDRVQYPPSGGSKRDYERWAKEVSGVTRAFVFPQQDGPGTVGVTFLVEDDPNSPIPSDSKVAQVSNYIDNLKPAEANVRVYPPKEAAVDIVVKISPNNSVTQNSIKLALEDLFAQNEPGGTTLLSHINETISRAPGEEDHVLVSPTANIDSAVGTLSTLGTITWQSLS